MAKHKREIATQVSGEGSAARVVLTDEQLAGLVPQTGKGFLYNIFGGKSFMACIIEIIKNSIDYGAKNMWITTATPKILQISDDGDGMGRKNKQAFVSVNLTTASSPNQAGKYGDGSKGILFSFAQEVTVVTVSTEDPEHVYRFHFTTEEYEDKWRTGTMILPEIMPKTTETWPHDYPTGTDITYVFADARSPSLKRSLKDLPEELAARLPSKFHGFIKVDGVDIPPKKIVGNMIVSVEDHPFLGLVSIEIYRPERRTRDERLRFTSSVLGEAPVNNLYNALGEYQDQFPEIFRHPDVCGTISVSYLRDYINEDRLTVRPNIADDLLTMHLLRYLRQMAEKVQRELQLRTVSSDVEDTHRQVIDDLESMVKGAYNPNGEGPPPDVIPPPPPPPPPGEERPLILRTEREFEVGEKIVVQAAIRTDLSKRIKVSDLQWLTTRSRGSKFKHTATGLEFMASEVGPGSIRADIPGTPHGASSSYEVVEHRVFHLSHDHHRMIVGKTFTLRGVNMDRVKGKLIWTLEGKGELVEQGADGATFHATHVTDKVVIRAQDSKNKEVQEYCEVVVVETPDRMWRIRDKWFRLRHQRIVGDPQLERPVTMQQVGTKNDLVFNIGGLGYAQAIQAGSPTVFLSQAIGMEFARFVLVELVAPEDSVTDPRDVRELATEILSTGYSVFEELMGKGSSNPAK